VFAGSKHLKGSPRFRLLKKAESSVARSAFKKISPYIIWANFFNTELKREKVPHRRWGKVKKRGQHKKELKREPSKESLSFM
jgi:hypothetical protein